MLSIKVESDCIDASTEAFWTDVQDEVATETSAPTLAESVSADPIRSADPVKTGYLRAFATRWLAPLAVIAGIALAGQSVFRLDMAFSNNDAAIASIGGLRAALSGEAPVEEMPQGLIVYGEEQYLNFRRGIVRFSDSDLLEYAATTARDMGAPGDLMTPFLLDALFLTYYEIERRGLSRPLASAEFDLQRETYRTRQLEL